MRDSMTNFVRPTPITDALYEYVLSVGMREPDVMRELREETGKLENGEYQIAPEQGPFLAMLVTMLRAKNGIEIGTFTGYSALWLAAAMPGDGNLICCDVSEEYTAIARKYWEMSGLARKIDLRIGPATATLESLLQGGWTGVMDYAFIDADKANYDSYYESCLKLVRSGGLIVIDNTLWDGKVADGTVTDADTVAIRDLNAKLHADERVWISFLPFADGLTLALKR